MKAPAIFQSADQNILAGALITSSDVPATGYDLETLGYLRPDMRVAFNDGTVTITWECLTNGESPTLPARGDIFVLPMHNLDDGVATLTNDQGLSQAITVPDPLGNGLPRTIVIDLTVATPNAATRTSAFWQLVVVGNSVPLVLGGAVAIYSPKQALADRDFQFGHAFKKKGFYLDAGNDFGTLFRQDLRTMKRWVELQTVATADDADALETWFEENHGAALPGLLWFDPNIQDAFLGYLGDTFARTYLFDDAESIALTFEELSKGVPL
jgi:hypothetical protein